MSDQTQAAPAADPAVESPNVLNESIEDIVGTEGEGEQVPKELQEKPSDTKEQKEAKREARRRFELKVNGKTKAVEVDVDNEDEMRKYLQKAFAADETFQEAAMTRKQAEQLVEMLRTNPLQILKHPELGLDIKELATRILNEEIEEQMKSPEQKRLEELEKRLAEKEAREKELEQKHRDAEMQRIQAEAYKQLDDEITDALGKSDLPKSPYVIKRIADAMIEATELGYTDVRVQDIMPYVESQVLQEIQQMFEAKPAEVMEKIVGKKNLDSYRKTKISKVKAKPAEVSQMKDTGAKEEAKAKQEEKPAAKKRFKDVFGTF